MVVTAVIAWHFTGGPCAEPALVGDGDRIRTVLITDSPSENRSWADHQLQAEKTVPLGTGRHRRSAAGRALPGAAVAAPHRGAAPGCSTISGDVPGGADCCGHAMKSSGQTKVLNGRKHEHDDGDGREGGSGDRPVR